MPKFGKSYTVPRTHFLFLSDLILYYFIFYIAVFWVKPDCRGEIFYLVILGDLNKVLVDYPL